MNSLLILTLLVGAVLAAPRAPCPKSRSLLDIPDHQLSHVFYRCSASGRHVRFECPYGLVYNPLRGVCDFPRGGYRADETTSSPATVTDITTSSIGPGGSSPQTTIAPTASSTTPPHGTPPTTSPVTVTPTTTTTQSPGSTPATTLAPPAHNSTVSPTGTTTSPATVALRHVTRQPYVPYVPRFLRKNLF